MKQKLMYDSYCPIICRQSSLTNTIPTPLKFYTKIREMCWNRGMTLHPRGWIII
jgi:hypothetical protein